MSLFTPNTEFVDNYYERGRFLLAWRISLSCSIIFSIQSVIYIISDASALLPMALIMSVAIGSLGYLKLTKNFKPLFWIFAISGTILANFAMNYVLDFTHYVDLLWVISCVLVAFIGLGTRYGTLFIVINGIGVAYFFWFTLNIHIETLQPKTDVELILALIEVLFAFFLIAYLLTQFVHFQQHSENELKKLNVNLEDQNKLILSKNSENETLLKEIHHRVKNNLQIVISLLRMQSMEMKSDESKTYFTEAINRIMAMFLVHKKLYGEKELSKIDLEKYIKELVNDIIAISLDKNNIELLIKVNVEYLSLDTIMPLGLLINELASNSLKHAFNDKKGQISIVINQTGDKFDFDYSDNGIWKTPVSDRVSFGVELIDILTDQMNGSKVLHTEKGTHYSFKLTNL